MRARRIFSLCTGFVLLGAFYAIAQEGKPAVHSGSAELARYEQEYSSARLETARVQGKAGVAVIFDGTKDLHYYARQETAPAGYKLEVQAQSEVLEFSEAVYPQWEMFLDPAKSSIEVYAGEFTVFVPIEGVKDRSEASSVENIAVDVAISGIACTSMICLKPFEKTLGIRIDYGKADSWQELDLEQAGAGRGPGYPMWFALGLALAAGLALNIMPCVWPVLPLIVMRIVKQAGEAKGKSLTMALAFCGGIILFFACLAAVNIILQVFYGTVLQWGDQFRSTIFLTGMALLLIVLSLYMFGLLTINIPSSIAAKSGSGSGYTGAIGTGFLAAILSTPCGFGILAVAFGWAQTQHWLPATMVIMAIGIGMATPYLILTALPGLMKRLPKAGRWMELFKQGVGFIMLAIAVKLILALPKADISGVLYFAVLLGFCVWMWGGWVDYNTKRSRRLLIRTFAVLLTFVGGWVLLAGPADELIEWQDYEAAVIESALAEDRGVLIKFTADWCVSCRAADRMVYHHRDIAELIKQKGVLAIKADTTQQNTPATLALKDIYNEPGVPVNMLFVPGRAEPIRWHGFLFRDELKQALLELDEKERDGKNQAEDKG